MGEPICRVTKVTRTFLSCPGCQKDEGFEIGYLFEYAKRGDCTFGPWRCACGMEVRGHIVQGTEVAYLSSFEQKAAPIDGFALVQIDRGERPPLHIILNQKIYQPEKGVPDFAYLIEQHQCPSGLLQDAQYVIDGDNTDPHGVLEFLGFAPKPEGWDDQQEEKGYTSYDELQALFGGALVLRGSIAKD